MRVFPRCRFPYAVHIPIAESRTTPSLIAFWDAPPDNGNCSLRNIAPNGNWRRRGVCSPKFPMTFAPESHFQDILEISILNRISKTPFRLHFFPAFDKRSRLVVGEKFAETSMFSFALRHGALTFSLQKGNERKTTSKMKKIYKQLTISQRKFWHTETR